MTAYRSRNVQAAILKCGFQEMNAIPLHLRLCTKFLTILYAVISKNICTVVSFQVTT